MLRFRPRVEEPISLLTRVTRIFQKSVFSKTTRDARAGCRAGLFVAPARVRRRRACFSCLQKKQGNTGDHAMQFQKGQSGKPAARRRGAEKGAAAFRRPPAPFGNCMRRYSAIVRTTLEVGRVSPGAPPVLLTTLRTCSSYEAIVVTGAFGFIKTTL